ncbi:bifunctional methionine sulfoxide reductase B/A protein [Shewanella acanthi]|uniref:bifunctional methionine sulfoxide reductase B/A protein n=1 Tax=Shewanella acanthi TaxID=2864212 RepID=UPI001C65FF67|nr:bifunctional methionine sulfoxide reductase B/A protein [Shewanella acanthi]QYJ77494.1 bifunctional methionine sulfoxide reductase B/A protein [Shewanella acanthi]
MKKLTDFERYVIEEKGTERPFSGEYYNHTAKGVYFCKKCDAPLYRSEDKFNAHCGWPAFDDEIEGAVSRHIDADGRRVEIVCSRCGGHLGHVFEGEYLTEKNIRHCVNSVSLTFKSLDEHYQPVTTGLATFGAGCFWCVEAVFKSLKGVNKVTSGYAGGDAKDADYRSVCSGRTGHAEVVQIEFDPEVISFTTLLQVLFESHDPTTLNRQGNDKGPQYRSVVFAHDAEQVEQTNKMIETLNQARVFDAPIVTQVVAFESFYPAEAYHNDYFALNGEQPYCQIVVRPKVEKIRALFAELQK